MSQHRFLTQNRLNCEIFLSFFFILQTTFIIKKVIARKLEISNIQINQIQISCKLTNLYTVKVGIQTRLWSFTFNFTHSVPSTFFIYSPPLEFKTQIHNRIRSWKIVILLSSFITCAPLSVVNFFLKISFLIFSFSYSDKTGNTNECFYIRIPTGSSKIMESLH